MLADLISPIVRCVPRIMRARPRISAAAVTPAVRPIVRAVVRRIPHVAMVCTVSTLPSAAMLPVPPVPPPVPAAAAAPLATPATLPYGIGAAPLLPPVFFAGGGGGGAGGSGVWGGPGGPRGGDDHPRREVLTPTTFITPTEIRPEPSPEPETTPVPEPPFLFATGLLALLAMLVMPGRRAWIRTARRLATGRGDRADAAG